MIEQTYPLYQPLPVIDIDLMRLARKMLASIRSSTELDADGLRMRKFHDTTSAGIPYVIPIAYALIGGGAGGGFSMGGGGGGADVKQGAKTLVKGTTYTITIAAPAAGSIDVGSKGTPGNSSIFDDITALGGAPGGSNLTPTGGDGENGGGAAGTSSVVAGGTGTSGNDGGSNGSGSAPYPSGGGAGDGGDGHAGSGSICGDGGDGTDITITGTTERVAGGGGGGAYSGATRGIGKDGGGNGGAPGNTGSNATPNSGGGGGGGSAGYGGGQGASGRFTMRLKTADYTGITTGSPTVTTDGDDTILTWTSSGSYTA